MTDRREAITLGAATAMAALFAPARAIAMSTHTRAARLETGLFNFKDGTSAEKAAEVVATLKELVQASGAEASLFGQNLDATPFATRFEWLYMIQYRRGELSRFRETLAPWVKDRAQCDLRCALPANYGDAPGVKVRHVVMFSFKPQASRADRERNVDAIREMGKLPMVQHYLVEPSAAPAADPDQMQWQVVGDFASYADFKAYADAPVHLAIREDFTAHTARVAWLDLQVSPG